MAAKIIMGMVNNTNSSTIVSQMVAITSVVRASGITTENMEDEAYQQEISALRWFLQQPHIVAHILQEIESDSNILDPVIVRLFSLANNTVIQVSQKVDASLNQ